MDQTQVGVTERVQLIRNTPRRHDCPACGESCPRITIGRRTLRDLCGVTVKAKYGKYWCKRCGRHFSYDLSHIAPPHHHYTTRLIRECIHRHKVRGMSYAQVSAFMEAEHSVQVAPSTVFDFVQREALL